MVGVGAALLAVLVPLLLTLAAGIRRELDHVRPDVAEVRRDLGDRVTALGERVARIEGALTGLWRPPANSPATPAASSDAPQVSVTP